jgi:hypothetical protein
MKNDFNSGFDAPIGDDAPWQFASTGSVSLDALVKAYARPKAIETEHKMVGKKMTLVVKRTAVNQEPCAEEYALQKLRGHQFGDDHRRAALEARLAISNGRFPLNRDEVAQAISEAFGAYFPMMAERARARRGLAPA